MASGARTVAVRVPPSGGPGFQENAGYHWQARTCDKTNRCSAWQPFGLNSETSPDFSVNAVEEDPVLDSVSLGQFNGATPIPVGNGTGGGLGSSQTVTFKALVADPDPGAVIQLEVEVQPTGTAFNGLTNLYPGTGVASTNTASTDATYTVPLLTASYHWRAHACDQTGRCSAWVPFGQNAESAADFHVP